MLYANSYLCFSENGLDYLNNFIIMSLNVLLFVYCRWLIIYTL